MAADESDDDQTLSFVALAKDTAVSHYTIIDKIGSGGMGDVYLAWDTELDRTVALKFLHPNLCRSEDCRKRFKREAQAAARLDHANIVTVHEVGEFQGRPYFVMQHVEGHSLRHLIKQGELSLEQTIDLAVQICEGLREAHELGIIHRDIKSSNILLDGRGNPKLVDFGLATIVGTDKLTKPGSTMGTVGYMSPEQAEGKQVDQRSDLFSLGVVLYEMITGRRPFDRDNEVATSKAIVTDMAEPLARYKSGIPAELQHSIDKALQKDPDTRYQSVNEFLADLRLIKRQMDSGITGPSSEQLSLRRPRRRGATIGIFLLVVLAVMFWLNPTSRRAALEMLGFDVDHTARHLAVLPFANLGETDEGRALCDGLLETLTSKLTEIEKFQSALWVVPASEVRQREVNSASQARRAFGATLAVTGSVQQIDGDIRMTLNLVDTKTQRQLRSVVIDDSAADVSSLQDSTVLMLADMLQVQLQPQQRQSLIAGGTAEREAYLLYVKARGHLVRFEKIENIDTAIAAFEQALDIDSAYSLAYAGLGEAYWRKYEILAEPDYEELAIYNSRRAIELNDEAAPVYATLGVIHHGRGRYQEAVSQFQQALKLDSASRGSYRGLATAYTALNKNAEAESTYQKIIELWPDHWSGYVDLGLFYQRRGRVDDALAQLDHATRLEPEGYAAWNNVGVLYYRLGQYDDARTAWERSCEIEPTFGTCSNLGMVYHMEKRYEEAAQAYKKALALNDRDYRLWINLASSLYQVPGAREEAVTAYREAVVRAERQLTINPRDTDLLSSLADCHAVLGNRNRALSYIRQALSLAPDDVEIMSTACLVYELLGERDTALMWIAEAVNRGYLPDDIESLPEMQGLTGDPRYQNFIRGGNGSPEDTTSRQ